MLAVATFNSTRSANASARVAERSLLAAQRPILIPSREDDPPEQIRFIDDVIVRLPGHSGIAKLKAGNLYLGMALQATTKGAADDRSLHRPVQKE